MRRTIRPRGIPIGRALDIPAGVAYNDLWEVVAAIDRVHGDGELPRIPVRFASNLAGSGRFWYDPSSGAPVSIAVATGGSLRQIAMLHEIGHFLDWCIFGEGRAFGSEVNPIMREWATAVQASNAYRTLNRFVHRQSALADASTIVPLSPLEVVVARNALLMEELWARSYSQFVTSIASSTTLDNGLATLRTRHPGRLYYPVQWEDDDFDPIRFAVAEIFSRLGWQQ